jgi:hypothetical protein
VAVERHERVLDRVLRALAGAEECVRDPQEDRVLTSEQDFQQGLD